MHHDSWWLVIKHETVNNYGLKAWIHFFTATDFFLFLRFAFVATELANSFFAFIAFFNVGLTDRLAFWPENPDEDEDVVVAGINELFGTPSETFFKRDPLAFATTGAAEFWFSRRSPNGPAIGAKTWGKIKIIKLNKYNIDWQFHAIAYK